MSAGLSRVGLVHQEGSAAERRAMGAVQVMEEAAEMAALRVGAAEREASGASVETVAQREGAVGAWEAAAEANRNFGLWTPPLH